MNNSTSLKSSNLGGVNMVFGFFKKRDILSRYRRNQLISSRNSFNYDLYCFLITNKYM